MKKLWKFHIQKILTPPLKVYTILIVKIILYSFILKKEKEIFSSVESDLNRKIIPKLTNLNNMDDFLTKKLEEQESLSSFLENTDLPPKNKSYKTLGPSVKSFDKIIKSPSLFQIASNTASKSIRKSNFLEQSPLSKKDKKKTFYDVITNFYLIKKFVAVLQSVTSIRKPKFMNEWHFNLIKDLTFFYSIYQEQTEGENNVAASAEFHKQGTSLIRLFTIKTQKIRTKMKNRIKKMHIFKLDIPVFRPFAFYMLFVDFLNIVIFAFFFLTFPIDICFGISLFDNELGFDERTKFCLKSLIIAFYMLDIFLSCNTSYYEKGGLIIERQKIISKYFHNFFFIDILALIIILFAFINFQNFFDGKWKIVMILYFLKYAKIRRIFIKIEELLVVDQFYFNILSLFLLVLRLILVTHIGACIWHLMAYQIPPDENRTNWLQSKNLTNEPWYVRYIYSFYYILITMNTVGYGDITPQNPYEVLFCVGFVFIACMMFGYCINCVGTIFQDFYKRESEFKKDLFTINDFMKTKNIPKELQIRIRKYLENLWKEEKVQNLEQAQNVLKKLSESLKFELLLEVNGPIIKNIDVLSQNFSEKTLREIIKFMKEERYTPGDVIFNKGDYLNRDMFLIKKGCVEIFVENDLNDQEEVKVLKELKVGQIFGEIAFFSDVERSASARSKEFTTLVRIDQSHFKNLIEENDTDREKYCHIKDLIRLYQNYDGIFLTCYSCNHRNHLIMDCPMLHRNFFKDVCIRKYNHSVFQEREKFERKRKKLPGVYVLDSKYEDYFKSCLLEGSQKNNAEAIFNLNEDDNNSSESQSNEIPMLLNEKKSSLECISPGIVDNMERNGNASISRLTSNYIKEDMLQSTFTNEKMKSSSYQRRKKLHSVHFAIDDEKSENNKFSSDKISSQKELNKNDIKDGVSLNFDNMRGFMKYFPLNNASFVINEANKKIFIKLKKKKKAHLFDKKWVNEEILGNSEKLLNRQFTSKINNSPKKNMLRKKSKVVQNWKEALEIAQLQKQIHEENQKKFRCLKVFMDFLKKFLKKNK